MPWKEAARGAASDFVRVIDCFWHGGRRVARDHVCAPAIRVRSSTALSTETVDKCCNLGVSRRLIGSADTRRISSLAGRRQNPAAGIPALTLLRQKPIFADREMPRAVDKDIVSAPLVLRNALLNLEGVLNAKAIFEPHRFATSRTHIAQNREHNTGLIVHIHTILNTLLL